MIGRMLSSCAAAGALLLALSSGNLALAQKSGGILKIQHWDSPASMSIHEEATYSTVLPIMGVMNNLVLYKQDVPQNSLQTVVPDLAESWSWSEDGTELTFKLRSGVKWHDGKPFTAKDVQCTWDLLLGKSEQKLRGNPRKSWYRNLDHVTANGDNEATFHLKRPQPAFVALLASGYSPVYPCHVTPAAPDRHGAVQVCRVQAERAHQGHAQPGLLEGGPALSRRHRVYDRPEPLDRDPRLCRRTIRRDLAVQHLGAAAEGHQEPGAAGNLRIADDKRHDQFAGQPRRASVR